MKRPGNQNANRSALPINLLPLARQVIEQEASALSRFAAQLDESFNLAVRLILELSPGGRVVVSGVGKAGFVGMKISATFASLGVHSFFLHPSEALHGDLGRYTEHDIALVLSKSGETVDIARLLPALRKIGCAVIAVTSKPESTLGKLSDLVISIGDIEEAGELGLAPTSSSTIMMALGDALALALAKIKGISKEQFAAYHPGGSLGHRLKKIEEIMRTGDRVCVVQPENLASEVLHRISTTKGRPGAALVVNGEGTLVGIFTDGDLRRCLDKNHSFLSNPISTVMGKNPKAISSSALVDDALRIMNEFEIDQLVVLDGASKPVGMVDIQDVLRIEG